MFFIGGGGSVSGDSRGVNLVFVCISTDAARQYMIEGKGACIIMEVAQRGQ